MPGSLVVKTLRRGGLWFQTPLGAVQLGAPAETLKDTLPHKDAIPRIVILPRTLVDVQRGVAIADLEFPIYWNLFVKKRPLMVVGEASQGPRIAAAVQESLLGPLEQNLEDDVVAGRPVPNLQKEQRWFRQGEAYSDGLLSLEDALDFRAADANGRIVIEEIGHRLTIILGADEVSVAVEALHHEAGARTPGPGCGVAVLPRDPLMPSSPPLEDVQLDGPVGDDTDDVETFQPPRFGVTVLGRSHGFDPDPKERTTGFVLWLGGRGVLVDPPINTTALLHHADIDATLTDGVILTHVHGDHDAGLLQKAVEAGRVTLWTTPSIFASWLRKWSALSEIPIEELKAFFDFRPVKVGAPTDIHGAKLIFRFTLHSIPAIAFEAHYQGASFNYSGDTLNEPEAVEAMRRAGHLDQARHEELNHFDWSHDLIFHESGIPPLHTPLSRLDALDDDIKRRLRVLHVTPARLVGHEGLIVAEPGRQHTMELPTENPPELRLLRNLRLLGRTPLFADLSMAAAADLLAAAQELHLKAGEQLIRQGSRGDALYVVTGGKASVKRDGQQLKVYGLGDYIGETAVFLRRRRNADVFALTDLELLAIDGDVARRVCEGTAIPRQVRRHARVRALDCWSLLEETALFSGLTVKQKNAFESILVPATLKAGTVLTTAGERATKLFLIAAGEVSVDVSGAPEGGSSSLGRGAIVGDIAAWLARGPQLQTTHAVDAVTGFRIDGKALRALLDKNPGLRVRVQPWTAHQTTTTAQGMARMVLEHLGEP